MEIAEFSLRNDLESPELLRRAMSDTVKDINLTLAQIAADLDVTEISIIPVTRGFSALIDKRFEDQVIAYKWYGNVSRGGHVYAVADVNRRRISLQRLIRHFLEPNKSLDEIKDVSFKNKCSLDCREDNLMQVTNRQAVMRNRRGKRNTSSQYKGVRLRRRKDGTERWAGFIMLDEGELFLGTYDDEHYAAQVYDAAAFLLFEGSGLLNFPDQPPNLDAVEEVRIRYARMKNIKARKMSY